MEMHLLKVSFLVRLKINSFQLIIEKLILVKGSQLGPLSNHASSLGLDLSPNNRISTEQGWHHCSCWPTFQCKVDYWRAGWWNITATTAKWIARRSANTSWCFHFWFTMQTTIGLQRRGRCRRRSQKKNASSWGRFIYAVSTLSLHSYCSSKICFDVGCF